MNTTLAREAETPDTVCGVTCDPASTVDEAGGHARRTAEPRAGAQPDSRSAVVTAGRPTRAANAPAPDRKAVWDRNNTGFWLSACIAISLLFSIIDSVLG